MVEIGWSLGVVREEIGVEACEFHALPVREQPYAQSWCSWL